MKDPFENAMHVQSLKHFLIRSRWRRWLGPLLCAVPYFASIIWLMTYSQVWIAMVMLVPALLILVIALLTWMLARIEFLGRLRRR